MSAELGFESALTSSTSTLEGEDGGKSGKSPHSPSEKSGVGAGVPSG